MFTFIKKFLISLVFLLPSLTCTAGKEPTLDAAALNYDVLVRKGSLLNNPIQSTPTPLIPSTFSQQPFLLWDYAEGVTTDPATGVTHWEELLAFINANNITTLVTYIKDPSSFPFFNQYTTGPSVMTYLAKVPSTCTIYAMYDSSGFELPSPYPAASPTQLPSPYPALPNYFSNLPGKMLWAQQATNFLNRQISAAIDPQPPTPALPGQYQLLIDFMDYYRTENNLTNMLLCITFGISSKNPTYSNTSTFPIPQDLQTQLYLPPITPGDTSPEWRPGTTYPLLNLVVIQAYEDDMPYIFTIPTEPKTAADDLLHNFRDEPYLLGEGTISIDPGSKNVVGTGTQFVHGTYPIQADMPIGLLINGNIVKVGIVNESTPITDTTFSFYSSYGTGTSGSVPFYQTEIVNKWTFPYITSDQPSRICIMFSFENMQNNQDPFFGTWTTEQFMLFLKSFYNDGQTELPFYYQDANTSIPLPDNFGIYDFKIYQSNVGT